jgi:hypothetical protein
MRFGYFLTQSGLPLAELILLVSGIVSACRDYDRRFRARSWGAVLPALACGLFVAEAAVMSRIVVLTAAVSL